MRIRKRSGVLFTSSSSRDRVSTSTSTSCVSIDTGHRNGEGEGEFLLPLVAAVMDVQRAEGEGDHGTHPSPAHNWRNALQLQHSGEGDSGRQALKDGVEGKKVDWRWNRSVRNDCDSIGLFTNQGTERAVLIKEDMSSSAEKEIIGGHDEEWKLPKSVLEMGNFQTHQKKLSVHSNKRERSKDEIGYMKGWKDDERKTTKTGRQESYIEQQTDEKAMPKKRRNDNNNEAEGSQCRRRNGRGWRCSQRTLVGYSLCEHHLGKGRLRSINNNNNNSGISTGIVNNKAGTCKLKELRLIDASRSCNIHDVNSDQQKPN